MAFVPPPDPRKPAIPYRPGYSFSIRRHVPPKPNCETRREELRRLWYSATQTDWCLQYPPQETPPPADAGGPEHTVHIVDAISCYDGRMGQIVRCRLDDNRAGGKLYVAKTFDALYYPADHTDDFVREAAAYGVLSACGVNGRYTPTYHGAWTFDMPVPAGPGSVPRSRPVRMILMDWIKGASMQSYMDTDRVGTVPPACRLAILGKALEADARISACGIHNEDFLPRNVMVADASSSSEAGQPVPDVYVIDFDHSLVMDHAPGPGGQRKEKVLPRSPMYHYWDSTFEEFASLWYFGRWIPQPYREQPAAFRGWLKSRWAHSRGFRTGAVSNFFLWNQKIRRIISSFGVGGIGTRQEAQEGLSHPVLLFDDGDQANITAIVPNRVFQKDKDKTDPVKKSNCFLEWSLA
ncbi:Protein kinase-like domain protein [Niveomyces insectorum RCEF 264]|uniref:Protein kinase-like domain protein n=1 Tax=Niveomyces insectorum RCEF 264 TaxID=1081102 RepID=A0A162IE75_9HYPO|nr:Protein kinase-like domain protein [Niveomyces insectorum RCEF 264]